MRALCCFVLPLIASTATPRRRSVTVKELDDFEPRLEDFRQVLNMRAGAYVNLPEHERSSVEAVHRSFQKVVKEMFDVFSNQPEYIPVLDNGKKVVAPEIHKWWKDNYFGNVKDENRLVLPGFMGLVYLRLLNFLLRQDTYMVTLARDFQWKKRFANQDIEHLDELIRDRKLYLADHPAFCPSPGGSGSDVAELQAEITMLAGEGMLGYILQNMETPEKQKMLFAKCFDLEVWHARDAITLFMLKSGEVGTTLPSLYEKADVRKWLKSSFQAELLDLQKMLKIVHDPKDTYNVSPVVRPEANGAVTPPPPKRTWLSRFRRS